LILFLLKKKKEPRSKLALFFFPTFGMDGLRFQEKSHFLLADPAKPDIEFDRAGIEFGRLPLDVDTVFFAGYLSDPLHDIGSDPHAPAVFIQVKAIHIQEWCSVPCRKIKCKRGESLSFPVDFYNPTVQSFIWTKDRLP
jgi:hypothetical protein